MTTFTIAMLTRNRPHMVTRALENIARIDWPRDDFEVVIVDDGSSASLSDVALPWRATLELRLITREHRGISASKNDCWRFAKGDFVAIIADDYELPLDYLRVASRFFSTSAAHHVLTYNMRSAGGGLSARIQSLYFEMTLWQTIASFSPREFLVGKGLPASRAAVFRRQKLNDIGGFDESLAGGEDFDLSLRFEKSGVSVHFAPESIVGHFEGEGLRFFLSQRRRYAENYFRLLKVHGKANARHFPLVRAIRQVSRQFLSWFVLAARVRRLGRFLLLSPGVLLWLTTFWLSVRRSSLASKESA